jgi:hypothetical protein
VTRANRYEPDLNRVYQEMAEHYGVAIIPTRPYISNERDTVVIAVPSVKEARMALLVTGIFEICPGSDDSVIDRVNRIHVRLVTIASKN